MPRKTRNIKRRDGIYDPEEFRKNLEKAMSEREVTSSELGKRIGRTKQYVDTLISPDTATNPHLKSIYLICDALEISAGDLLDGDRDRDHRSSYSEKRLLSLFGKLDDERKEALLRLAELLS